MNDLAFMVDVLLRVVVMTALVVGVAAAVVVGVQWLLRARK